MSNERSTMVTIILPITLTLSICVGIAVFINCVDSCTSRQLPDDEQLIVVDENYEYDAHIRHRKPTIGSEDSGYESLQRSKRHVLYDDDNDEVSEEVVMLPKKKPKTVIVVEKPDPPKQIIVVDKQKSASTNKKLDEAKTKLDETKSALDETLKQTNFTQTYVTSAADNLNKRIDMLHDMFVEQKNLLTNISDNICCNNNDNIKNAIQTKLTNAKDVAGEDSDQLEDLKKLEHHAKYINDRDLLKNSLVSTKVRDKGSSIRKGVIVNVDALKLAERLRFIMDKTPTIKRMVSVCYHNDPDPFYDKHPLAPNDGPEIQSIFNGTMDALHQPNAEEPNSPFNLDKPNYVNALLLEIKSLNKQFVSICLEHDTPDIDYTYPTECINVAVKRKEQQQKT